MKNIDILFLDKASAATFSLPGTCIAVNQKSVFRGKKNQQPNEMHHVQVLTMYIWP